MSFLWRYLSSSVIGVSHEKDGSTCQDANQCLLLPSREGETLFIAIVADGAGSAKYGKDGANIICRFFLDKIERLIREEKDLNITKEHILQWLDQYQYEVSLWSACCRIDQNQFASTLLGTIIGENRAIFWQIGDGAMVINRHNKQDFEYVFWPQQGEYANQTFFATDPASINLLQYRDMRDVVQDVALFTDGLQHIALHYEKQTAYTPFFRPLIAYLQSADWNYETGQQKLRRFLSSERINQRTDDDKTLVIASRYWGDQHDDE